MAQADYVVANGTGAAVRSDLNGQLAAIVSNNSGATEPATMYAYQWWADTTAGLLRLRNSANSAWVTIRQLDGEFSTVPVENGTAAAPSIYFKDSGTDSGFFSPGTDAVAISTAGANRLHITSAGLVGIGTSSPGGKLDVRDAGTTIPALGAVGTGLNVRRTDGAIGLIIGYENAVGGSYIQAQHTNGSATAYPLYLQPNGGNVGIGTTSPQLSFVCSNGGANGFEIDPTQSTGTITGINSYNRSSSAFTPLRFNASEHRWDTASTERARIDSSGRLLVGTSSTSSSAGLQVTSSTGGESHISRYLASGTVVSTDLLGRITFGAKVDAGTPATNYDAASIACWADGTWGSSSDTPTRLVFSTIADGASTSTERIRINNDGWLISGGSSDNNPSGNNALNVYSLGDGRARFSTDLNVSVECNRKGDDGSLINFRQDSTVEGSISVSGTTVSYNGAHLSRWSQLASGAERIEILRGSVLSNIDEMCEWGEEDNEQLNRMKVSDVEGDKNVSGVFQAWDDDDDTYTNDFYCAMTGDFIIRIAEGVTVERGDLLMSAGDGTAKPQDDDIIRSKTIAKVTSTNVSCTYEDGSYCVPCVLMAC
jgi:hypothetical protein